MKKSIITLSLLAMLSVLFVWVTSCEKELNRKTATSSTVNLNDQKILTPTYGVKKKIRFALRHANWMGPNGGSCDCPGCVCPGCPCPIGICICFGIKLDSEPLNYSEQQMDMAGQLQRADAWLDSSNRLHIEFEGVNYLYYNRDGYVGNYTPVGDTTTTQNVIFSTSAAQAFNCTVIEIPSGIYPHITNNNLPFGEIIITNPLITY
ncbi:MAG: hypothetical protein KF882_05055 [Bacteroidia bacterium]|nr:hypothetical protein [Bacteroidia bacterium]MCO5253437.1 hypothetical protein [Bacteroidota bacterium]